MDRKQNKSKRSYVKKARRDEVDSSNTKNTKERRDKYHDNDPSWYLVNGQLAKDVANFSFNQAVGDPIVLNPGFVSEGITLVPTQWRLPGIMAFQTMPTVGLASDATSPINVAMRNIYSYVRHANSGHANYDPADLMIYLMAADSVQIFWSYMVRLYGLTQTFSQRNRYIGDALIRANGVDPANLRANLAQFRSYINQYAIKASVLAVPAYMSYFMRHAWMYQNVYMDENNPKAQLYMFVPAFLYRYGLDSNGAGSLIAEPYTATVASATGTISSYASAKSVLGIMAYGDALIDSMLQQEDVGIMSGDILKAFGSDKLYKFTQLEESYALAPVFSEEVLSQIHNTNFVGNIVVSSSDGAYVTDTSALNVTQNTSVGGGELIFQPMFMGSTELAYTHIIDHWKDDVSPEDAIVMARNLAWMSPTAGTVKTKDGVTTLTGFPSLLSACGSELIFTALIWQYGSNGTLTSNYIKSFVNSSNLEDTYVGQNVLSKFNEAPMIRRFNTATNTIVDVYGELTNYTTVDQDAVRAMHNTALLSMFGVPYQW